MISTIVLLLATLACESSERLGAAPMDREAVYGGRRAVDAGRDVRNDAQRRPTRSCVETNREVKAQGLVVEAPHLPHVQPPKPEVRKPQK